jgi:hypothetical protein
MAAMWKMKMCRAAKNRRPVSGTSRLENPVGREADF